MSDDIPQQQTFDWTKDVADAVEGIKYDTQTEYEFEWVEFSKHDKRFGKNHPKVGQQIVFKNGDRAGQPVLFYTVEFKEVTQNGKFRLEYMTSEKYRVNPENPELEDALVKFARKVGYNPLVGGKVAPNDFVQIGLHIKAMLKFQAPRPDETLDEARGVFVNGKTGQERKAYTEIDVDTISCDGVVEAQQSLPEQVDRAVVSELQGMIDAAPKAKKFSELVGKINKAKKTESLLQPAMLANEQKMLKF